VRILRSYIDDDLNDAAASYNWTWSNWSSGQDNDRYILAKHFTEMRAAIQVLWNTKGRGPLPSWTQETPQGPSTGSQNPSRVRATHVTDLRAWLNQYEENHPPLTQGINSLSYDPLRDTRQPLIYNVSPNDWTGDVASLSEVTLFVRLEVVGRRYSDTNLNNTRDFLPVDFENYKDAYLQYKNRGMRIFLVFTQQFHNPIGANYSTDAYRIDFANKLRDFLLYMRSYNVGTDDVIIWNEPNSIGIPAYLSEDNFANLLYRCWKRLKDSSEFQNNMPRIH
jgi:hypothetical protein